MKKSTITSLINKNHSMKAISFSILFVLFPKLCHSQASETKELILSPNDKFIYLDSTNQESKTKNYYYIRVIKDSKLNKKSYAVQEYYRSGEIRMEGTSKTNNGNSKEGIATYYYKNTNKKSLTNYVKGRVNGINLEWYENGSKKLEGEYIEDEKKMTSTPKINQFWDVNGVQKVVDGNGFFEDQEDNEYEKGEVKNGFKDGIWEGKNLKEKSSYTEIYNEGILVSGISTDENNNKYPYNELITKPTPAKGMTDFYSYIQKNYKIPETQGLKGTVYTTFLVDTDGSIMNIRVLRDVGYGTGTEAIRVIASYGKWIPGKMRGILRKETYSLPLNIQSIGNSPSQEPTYESEMTRTSNRY